MRALALLLLRWAHGLLDNYVPFEKTDAYRNLQDLSDQWQAEDADERAEREARAGAVLG